MAALGCPFCPIRGHAYTFFPFINVSLSLPLALHLILSSFANQHSICSPSPPVPLLEKNKCILAAPFGDNEKTFRARIRVYPRFREFSA